MSKAILVMDMPESCFSCKLSEWANCRITKRCHVQHSRPFDCPLHELPQKKDERDFDSDSDYFGALGYNACIDEILKGSE